MARVELVKGIPFICKIGLTEQKPPITIAIRYLEGHDVHIFGSYTE